MAFMMIKSNFATLLGLLLATASVSCTPVPPKTTRATPDAIKATIETSTAPLVLAHVWATWCDPCRDEFPELLKAFQFFENQGLELLLISADDPAEMEAVQKFLTEQGSPVGSLISTELSQEFIENLSPKWAGSLPSSFFYSKGTLLEEWEGKRTYEQYMTAIETLLNQTKEP
jgi:thiol-disulfide isomerase/thioredoxin